MMTASKFAGTTGHRLIGLIAVAVFLWQASGSRAEDVGSTTAPLLGDITYDDDCTTGHVEFNNTIVAYGRMAAASEAFAECLDTQIRARYRKCLGDPGYSESIDQQIVRVLAVARSLNGLNIHCSGGNGNASSDLGPYDLASDENLWWGSWFASVYSHLGDRPCGAGEQPDPDNCSYAPLPWPYSQAAGIVWHEAMHQHGYTHGANDQANAIVACGYAGDANWHFQRNTMPYIVEGCIDEVIDQSGRNCGGIESCPGDNQLNLVDGDGSSTCECVNDPGRKGLALLRFEYPNLADGAILPTSDWVGGWHYGDGDKVAATGDFNGDGNADLLLTSAWGLGLITHNGTQWAMLAAIPNGARIGSWTWQGTNSVVRGVGDFNGDGRDEFLVTTPSRIGLIGFSSSAFVNLVNKPSGTWFGGWNFNAASDVVRGLGDFNGDNRTDVLLTSAWGVGILSQSGSTFISPVAKPNGSSFGGWSFSSTQNVVRGIGDFNGDTKADILVTSAWGLGILTQQGTSLTSLVVKPNGTAFGGWKLNSTQDAIRGIADFDADGRDDILVTSSWGIGMLKYQTSSLTSLMVKPNGTSFGGWAFDSTHNTIVGVGKIDYDRRADVIVRSSWGMGILELSGSTLNSVFGAPNGTLLGSWPLESSDRIAGVDFFAGAFGDSLVIQR